MRELSQACLNNFKDDEPLRLYLQNRCPKFGNDCAQADEIAVEIYNFLYAQVSKYKTVYGDSCHPSYFAYVMHGVMGGYTDATPDGRRAGEALSEHLGSVQGMDKKGPLAVMRSIAKLDQSLGIGGIATNYRFGKGLVSTKEGRQGIADFIRLFMANDCFEIQFNILDGEELKRAQREPDKYKTLLVRVAGYSDYFVNLSPIIQNEIMKRTEYC